jgi:lysyl-tRNA synthetase class 2
MPRYEPPPRFETLQLRAALLRRLREFFDRRGFVEVETPLLCGEVIADSHIEPFPVPLDAATRAGDLPERMWLQTSPEACMKRLLASGAKAIYQVTRSFRAGERGRLHNPEFTIVEWYRAGDDMQAGMRLLSELCEALLERGPAEPVGYRQAFFDALQLDPHTAPMEALRARAAALGASISAPSGDVDQQRDELLNVLLALAVEPRLGAARPSILFDYPASQAALAVVRDENPPVAERFELYVEGVELANGYHELLDAEALAARQIEINCRRVGSGLSPLPTCERLLAAVQHGLPPCTGVALGFDRLVMLAAGANRIDDVLAFPIHRA